jgi:hypothetical protein
MYWTKLKEADIDRSHKTLLNITVRNSWSCVTYLPDFALKCYTFSDLFIRKIS